MTTSHLHRLVRILVFAATAGGAGCTAYPSAPADPVYETDVRPIFLAHCTRCHGDGPDGGGVRTIPGASTPPGALPLACYTQYGSSPACHFGAISDVSLFEAYIGTNSMTPMPPPPAPSLNSYEQAVILNWAAEATPTTAPKCSDSPNPDPALFCPSGSYP
jgi:hypothetical protein